MEARKASSRCSCPSLIGYQTHTIVEQQGLKVVSAPGGDRGNSSCWMRMLGSHEDEGGLPEAAAEACVQWPPPWAAHSTFQAHRPPQCPTPHHQQTPTLTRPHHSLAPVHPQVQHQVAGHVLAATVAHEACADAHVQGDGVTALLVGKWCGGKVVQQGQHRVHSATKCCS